MQNNAFNILHDQGFTNSQLSVRGVGGAVPVGQFTDAATSVIGVAGASVLKPNQVTFNYFGNDPVPTQSFIGGNPGFSTLRHLWTVLTGPDNTQHSCYGTGAAGCAQVETPTANGYRGTPDGNATLYKYVNGVLVTTPVNSK